jgi:hypothetical protein
MKHGFTTDASAITFRMRLDCIPKRNLDNTARRSLVDKKCIGDGWWWNLGWGPVGGDVFMITTFKGCDHCVAHRFELARASFTQGNQHNYATNVTLGILNAYSYSSVALDAKDNVAHQCHHYVCARVWTVHGFISSNSYEQAVRSRCAQV